MPLMKLEAIFDIPGSGWSETYYAEFTDVTQALNSMEEVFGRYRTKLMGTTAEGTCRIIGYRAQDLTDPKKQDVRAVNQPGTYPVADTPADMPWTGVLVRISGAGGSHRSFTIRGVPDIVVEDSFRGPIARNAWTKAMNDWFFAMRQLGFFVQSLKEAGNPLVTIQAITNANDKLTVTTAAAHGLVDGDYVSFYHVKAHVKIQGRYRITKVDAVSFTVTPFNFGTIGFVEGRYRKVVFDYDPWTTINYIRKAERKAGRPFFQLRGRN